MPRRTATPTIPTRSRLPQDDGSELRERKIHYIPAAEFDRLTASRLTKQAPAEIYEASESDTPEPAIGQLLTPAGEQHLFRSMNFFKHQAQQLQLRASRRSMSPRREAQFHDLLKRSAGLREQIVNANLRLVSSIAGKFATSPQEYDDLVSEGNLILVNAVDKFDYSRGFRFSTYATHAVQRHFFRLMQRRQRRRQREVSTSNEILAGVIQSRESLPMLDPAVADTLLKHFEQCLDARERMIIEQRFGLNEETEAGTLKAVADRAGISKERVRQLQARAVEKLQDLALQLKLRPETCL